MIQFNTIRDKIYNANTPKQFVLSKKIRGEKAVTLSPEDNMKINNSYRKNCSLLDTEEMQGRLLAKNIYPN